MNVPGRAWLVVLVAAASTGLLVGCSGGGWEDRCQTGSDGVIQCAPDERSDPPKVTGELLDGSGYDVTREHGQVVVVNFCGSWCAPCVAEADDLEATYQATKGSGVRFLGVNVRDDQNKARAFEQGRSTYPSIFDPSSRVALEFDPPPSSPPATIVLDRHGRIAVVIRAAVRRETLEPIVNRVAAEEPASGGSR